MTREELRRTGEAMRAELFRQSLSGDDGSADAVGYRDFAAEVTYGSIWSRPGLDLPSRMLCTLCALSVTQRMPQLRDHVAAALDLGLAARTILEAFVQCGLYAGYPTAENSIAETMQVFSARGITVPSDPPRTDSLEALTERGQALLERLHGDRGRQGYASPDNPVTGALYPLAIQYGYGELWYRPGLDQRQRALCAVAAFTALRLEAQVGKFGVSALNMGLSREAVIEAVIQTAPFSGFPGALNALAVLSERLKA